MKETSIFEKLLDFFKLAVPTTVSNTCMNAIYLTNLLFGGSLNDAEKLAGIGVATTTHFVLSYSLMFAAAKPMETYTSQAFGNGDLRLCGVYLNRSRAIVSVFFIPLALLLSRTKDILLAFNQNPKVVEYASDFVITTIPAYYILAINNLSKRWLASMRLTFFPMYAQIIAGVFHIVWCYLFVIVWEMDLTGIAYAFQ